jgi:hypothetical protein
MTRFVQKPRTGEWRENERWEEDVSAKVTDSDESLSDVEQRVPPPLWGLVRELEKRVSALEQNNGR